MPRTKQPAKLSSLCIDALVASVDTYWLRETSELRQCFDRKLLPLHLLDQFQVLSNENVACILQRLSEQRRLVKYHLFLFVHSRLTSLDLSLVRPLKTTANHRQPNKLTAPPQPPPLVILSPGMCKHIAAYCHKLTELDMSSQSAVMSKSLCDMLSTMKRLVRLNLSGTRADEQVVRLLVTNKLKLQLLDLSHCPLIFDDEVALIAEHMGATLTHFYVSQVRLSAATEHRVLDKCVHMKCFHARDLISAVQEEMALDNLEIFHIDAETVLKERHMECLAARCIGLKSVRMRCTGSHACLAYLARFEHLAELDIGNLPALITFQFAGSLLDALAGALGKRLRALALANIPDVNIRAIMHHCPNLVKLSLELLSVYNPAADAATDVPLATHETAALRMSPLRHLTIVSVAGHESNQIASTDVFRSHVVHVLTRTRLKYLQLAHVHDMDEAFFRHVLSVPSLLAREATGADQLSYAHSSIETLELKQLPKVTSRVLVECLFENDKNELKHLKIVKCARIKLANFLDMIASLKRKQLDCFIKWHH